MYGGEIIGCFIYGLVALIMIGIGIANLKSKKPVGFYSGEKPPTKDELTDWEEWNKKHGRMWIIYGCIIFISYFIGFTMIDSIACIIPMTGGMIIPIPVMIHKHNKYLEIYKKKEDFN